MYTRLLSPSQNLATATANNALSTSTILGIIPVRSDCPNGCTQGQFGGVQRRNCPICGSKGYIETPITSHFTGRGFWMNDQTIRMAMAQWGIVSGEMADIALTFPIRYEWDIRQFLLNKAKYFLFDGKRLSPMGTPVVNSVTGETSLIVFCTMEKASPS